MGLDVLRCRADIYIRDAFVCLFVCLFVLFLFLFLRPEHPVIAIEREILERRVATMSDSDHH